MTRAFRLTRRARFIAIVVRPVQAPGGAARSLPHAHIHRAAGTVWDVSSDTAGDGEPNGYGTSAPDG